MTDMCGDDGDDDDDDDTIFLRTKACESRQNRFRDKTA